MSGWRPLCRLNDIPANGEKGFPAPPGRFIGLFAVRHGDDVHVYVNASPHLGLSLDWAQDRVLSTDRSRIVCANHGASFDIATGLCTDGPCLGERLERVMIRVEDGVLHVPEDAGR